MPRPPAGRLPFLLLMLRTIGNPVASWSEDFYDEPIVVYRTLGLETVFVMDPELIQQILLDDSESFTKSPLYDHVLGGAGGKGLLIAEGDDWRWQRRIAAPLFSAEELLAAPADVVAGVEVGKERGMDAGKLTAVDLFGVDGASGSLGNFRTEAWPSLKLSEPRPTGFAPLFARRAGKRANPRRRAARCRSAGCWR